MFRVLQQSLTTFRRPLSTKFEYYYVTQVTYKLLENPLLEQIRYTLQIMDKK